MRRRLFRLGRRPAAVSAAVFVAMPGGLVGCEDAAREEPRELSRQQAGDELRSFGVTVPDTYLFVSAVKTPRPGAGAVDYAAVYESPRPARPVSVDDAAVVIVPADCAELGPGPLPDGLGCSWVTDVHRGRQPLARHPGELSVVSVKLPSGQLRIYVALRGR